jgi:palmitoyl transferase
MTPDPILHRSVTKHTKARMIAIVALSTMMANIYPTSTMASCLSYVEEGYEYIKNIAVEGENEFHLPLYAWHARYAYSREKVKKYNEILYGFGFGRGITDCCGNWSGLFGTWFLDSKKNFQPLLGFAQTFNLIQVHAWEINLGYATIITARKDIAHYTPFPGLLPVVSIAYQPVTLYATYIPVKNVVCIFSKFAF